ncbi:hypothetical protein L6164_008919 [Bauhinia variegata]|uniref:Uncharacterized protein n=1 Tax=Bauhinia variegata TaxID=167791 RepID=A0ACB9PI00_BAUVA|nr:hypothetical protein L6164_008919 [Bauhinia variegata]
MQKPEEVDSLVCPSFNCYSSDGLVDVADRVTRDKTSADDHRSDNDTDNDGSYPNNNDFEFVTLRKAADGVFFDGCVGPVFPVFNQDLLREDESSGGQGQVAEEDVMALQFPMRRFLNVGNDNQRRDRDPPSSSSSEVDEVEEIPPGSYCVWTPNSAKASPNRCKKSNSTGSSSFKRWKLLDLLRRSNSDGKNRDSLVFLTPSSSNPGSNLMKKKEKKAENSKEQLSTNSSKVTGKKKGNGSAVAVAVTGGEKKVPVSAHEAFYVRNRELKKADKRRSYLPYRQDLVGFFASLNGIGKTFPPF